MRNLFVTLWVEDEREKYKIYINGEKKETLLSHLIVLCQFLRKIQSLRLLVPFQLNHALLQYRAEKMM